MPILTANLKTYLAIVAIVVAVLLLVFDQNISQGTGIIVATLAAGAGWLVRDTNDEARAIKNICQAYAALIESQFEEFQDCLSDSELNRFISLAPAIAVGTEPELTGHRAADPYVSLPDIRNHRHLLSHHTVRWLAKWQVRGLDLFDVYDKLGTREVSALSAARLTAWFDWVKEYRDRYRDTGYTCLLYLAEEAPGTRHQ